MAAIDALYVLAFALNLISAYLHFFCGGSPILGLFNVFLLIMLMVEVA